MTNKKPNPKLPLHKFIAAGGKPKDHQGAIKSTGTNPKQKK